MREEIRAQLIKQLPMEVVENADITGELYYACPVCRRPVTFKQNKCLGCNQTLGWENVRKEAERNGQKRGRVEFDLPLDFTKGNCRKCPLSYIGKSGDDKVYECPFGSRNTCRIEVL